MAITSKQSFFPTCYGPELRGRALDGWADDHGVQLCFINPGKPTQNAYIESFNGRYREECLNQHWFTSIGEAQEIIEEWRIDYNTERPHSSLKYQTPEAFAAARPFDKTQWPSRLSHLMAPRLRPLLTPPNDGTQNQNRLDLRVALKTGAGQMIKAFRGECDSPNVDMRRA